MLLPAFATTLRLQEAKQVRLGPLVVCNSVCVCACGLALLHQTITALQAGQAALSVLTVSFSVHCQSISQCEGTKPVGHLPVPTATTFLTGQCFRLPTQVQVLLII